MSRPSRDRRAEERTERVTVAVVAALIACLVLFLVVQAGLMLLDSALHLGRAVVDVASVALLLAVLVAATVILLRDRRRHPDR